MKYLAILLVLPTALSCTPLAITNIKVINDTGCVCLSRETNQEARCKVTYCEGTMCYTSTLEPEYSTLHSIGIPQGMKDVTITAIGRDSQAATYKVK